MLNFLESQGGFRGPGASALVCVLAVDELCQVLFCPELVYELNP